MRSDRRFDGLVEANAPLFDIAAASDRELRAAQSAVDTFPKSLAVRARLIVTLINQLHYEAALATADAVLVDIRSTNFPYRVFEDYGDALPLFLNYRAEALERVGRWDEAVEQLTAASRLHEKYSGNVDELINLGELYADLGRPQEALDAIHNVLAKMSPYGAMQLESVRLDAAYQLGDSTQVARSLKFLETHRADAPATYVYALLTVNQPDHAASALISGLRDPLQRRVALRIVQEFASTPETPRELALDAALQSVTARTDVQSAIRHVGRVDRYNLEP
jgi:tetratricopeptide (TPR) repeat protein